MIAAAADAVAGLSDASTPGAPLLPPVRTCGRSRQRSPSLSPSRREEGLAQVPVDDPIHQVHEAMWRPEYPHVEPVGP